MFLHGNQTHDTNLCKYKNLFQIDEYFFKKNVDCIFNCKHIPMKLLQKKKKRLTFDYVNKEHTKQYIMQEYLNEAQEMMEMAILHVEDELARIRAGKANTRILDGIRVDSYGSMVPLSNVASVTTPDARTIAIKPWDKNMIRIIEKAIIDSPVGITPENNGEVIRLGIPPLTEERRKQLAKQCKEVAENSKISIRNARRDCIDALKKAVKDGMPEDVQKDGEEKLQKLHDKYIKKVDELYSDKEKEIMTV